MGWLRVDYALLRWQGYLLPMFEFCAGRFVAFRKFFGLARYVVVFGISGGQAWSKGFLVSTLAVSIRPFRYVGGYCAFRFVLLASPC